MSMTMLEAIKQRITIAERDIKGLTAFRETIKMAVEQYTAKKYAPLLKAQEDYGDLGNAYGYGWIGAKKYERLRDLERERDDDRTDAYFEKIDAYLSGELKSLEKTLEELKRNYDYYKTKEEE